MSGDDQSDALAARDAQAWAVLEAGDPARAADLFEALLAEQVPAYSDPTTPTPWPPATTSRER